jgi:hypothetical protein
MEASWVTLNGSYVELLQCICDLSGRSADLSTTCPKPVVKLVLPASFHILVRQLLHAAVRATLLPFWLEHQCLDKLLFQLSLCSNLCLYNV